MNGQSESTHERANASWVWEYMKKFSRVDDDGETRSYVKCLVHECGHEWIFAGSNGLTRHLQTIHNLFKHEASNKDILPDNPKDRHKKANEHLMKFITTGFLPFTIVDNTYFQM